MGVLICCYCGYNVAYCYFVVCCFVSQGSFELPADVLFWWTAKGFVSKGFWYLQQRGFLLNGVQGECFVEGDILNSDVARGVNSWVELTVQGVIFVIR